MSQFELLCGDALEMLRQADDGQVRCIVTSPPYWGLRDYGTGQWQGGDPNCDHKYANAARHVPTRSAPGDSRELDMSSAPQRPMLRNCRWCGAQRVDLQVGLEPSPLAYVQRLVELFREIRRVLTDDGTVWLNLGDSYVTRPRGNKEGAVSTSSLTNPERQERVYPHNVKYRMRNGRPDGDPKSQQIHAERCEMYRFRSSIAFDFDPKAKNGLVREDGRPNRRQDTFGLKHKDLVGIPWRVAFALQDDGWYLRDDIIWAKSNPLPESVKDRPTRSHEYLFLLSKSPSYYYDYKSVMEPAKVGNHPRTIVDNGPEVTPPGTSPHRGLRNYNLTNVIPIRKNDSAEIAAARSDEGKRVRGFQERWDEAERQGIQAQMRNKRDVWTLASEPYKGAHFAVMPTKLVEPCVLAGSAPGDLVMDPFCGSGTVGVVALRHDRNFVGIDLNAKYLELAKERIEKAERIRLQETA